MVTLPTTRRKAEEFAAAVDGRAQPTDPHVAALASLAEALREIPGPAPEFRDQLRRRLVAVGSVQPAVPAQPAPPLTGRWRAEPLARPARRRLRLATGLVAAATGLAAVSVGASTSLPGSPLYGLKRTAERVQLAAAGSDLDRGLRELGFARARLHEIAALVSPAGPAPADRVQGTFDAMDDETADGARYLARDYQARHEVATLLSLHQFAVRQYAGLQALRPELPRPVAARAGESLVTLASIDQVVYPVLRSAGGCAAACAPQLPAPPEVDLPGAGPQPAPSRGVPGAGGGTGAPGGSTGQPGTAPSTGAGTGQAPVPAPTGAPGAGSGTGGGGEGPSTGPTGGLGGILPGTGSTGGGLPLPLPTTTLPGVEPVPVPSVSVPLPGGGGVGVGPSPTGQPSGGSTSAPVTVCVPPLVLVNGVCVSLSLPPLVP